MEILVEIAVTHLVDDIKLQKIKNRGIHAIEINVSEAHAKMDFALLNRLLFDVPSHGCWLYHPEVERYENEYVAKQEKEWKKQYPLEDWVQQQLKRKEELEEQKNLLMVWKQQQLF